MTSPNEIKIIYREELNKLIQKYDLDANDVDKIYSVFCTMYDNDCNGISESRQREMKKASRRRSLH